MVVRSLGYFGIDEERNILHLIDGVSYNRLTCSTTSIQVPALQDTTVEVKNISPRYLYTGSESEPILLQSRPHVQGEIFWGTVSTFHPKGTVLPNQERVQVPRHVRNTRKPQYSASKKVKATKHSNIVPGWVKTEWNKKYFYPKTGTGILKKRRHALRTGKLVGTPELYGFPVYKQQLSPVQTKKGLFADSDDEE